LNNVGRGNPELAIVKGPLARQNGHIGRIYTQ
jgi:hypothetical protein